ncbi:MAG: ParB N-terminal domain-containing protein [Roseovarius sp.]|jgi:ParB-like chromosome segregation protein Spo0J|nr:ParB N-terminal domain-containing protein [Roseovarius sp.]
MTKLSIKEIRADEACQLRAAGSAAAVAEYAAALAEGAIFPPVTVFRDAEGRYWLADGFHRLEAHKLAGRETISADVREGDRREAMLFAAGANSSHGLRRTQEDKREAIAALLNDPEWRRWSDREIAKRTATSNKTVARLRREIAGGGLDEEILVERKFTTKHGTEATRRVPAGKPKADLTARVLAGLPDDAILAEVARRGWEVTK